MYERILHDTLRFPDHVPALVRSWLEQLLVRTPDQRLGGGPKDAEDVKAHAFFADINWSMLDRREITPPFNPNVSNDMDLRNFDPEFVNEPLSGSLMPSSQTVSGLSETQFKYETGEDEKSEVLEIEKKYTAD